MNQGWKYYFIEFLVIVAGITVSFLISEWSSTREDREQEIRLLNNLQRDLAADTVILRSEAREIEQGAAVLNWMLEAEPETIVDSINSVIGALCSYSTVSVNQSTYQEITHAGGAQYLRNKEILGVTVDYYSNRINITNELVDIGKRYVLNEVMPYVQQNLPFLPDIADSSRHQDFVDVFESDTFKNHILFSLSWKGQQMHEFRQLSLSTDSTLKVIDEEIRRLSRE